MAFLKVPQPKVDLCFLLSFHLAHLFHGLLHNLFCFFSISLFLLKDHAVLLLSGFFLDSQLLDQIVFLIQVLLKIRNFYLHLTRHAYEASVPFRVLVRSDGEKVLQFRLPLLWSLVFVVLFTAFLCFICCGFPGFSD